MKKDVLPVSPAPGQTPAYSQAQALTGVKRLVFVSGQLALDEKGELVGRGDVAAQTEQCLKNMASALGRLGATLADVVQITIFVKDIAGLKDIQPVRLRYFQEPFPTSTLIQVTGFVHPEASIEINALAAL